MNKQELVRVAVFISALTLFNLSILMASLL